MDNKTKFLVEMFDDMDPDYITMRAMEVDYETDLDTLVISLSDKVNDEIYATYLKGKHREEMRQMCLDEKLSVDKFNAHFTREKLATFLDPKKQMSNTYCRNSLEQLLQDFPYFSEDYIQQIYRQNNSRYVISYDKLVESSNNGAQALSPQNQLDDEFLQERLYVRIRNKIRKINSNTEKERQDKINELRNTGKLKTCQCCYEEEVLEEEMSSCSFIPPHFYCNKCIRRHVEEKFGQSILHFRCIFNGCKECYKLQTLKNVLSLEIFDMIVQKIQTEEIAAAKIPNLECCPFCDFSIIMPYAEDKVFKCLNKECHKKSCRHCKEIDHLPEKCKPENMDDYTRTYLENELTKSIVRECYKCSKRIIRQGGCNSVICVCGAEMCYHCKKPRNSAPDSCQNRCPASGVNDDTLHAMERKRKVDELKAMDPKYNIPENNPLFN